MVTVSYMLVPIVPSIYAINYIYGFQYFGVIKQILITNNKFLIRN